MSYRAAMTMLLIVFVAGVTYSATNGPLRHTETDTTTQTTLSISTQTSVLQVLTTVTKSPVTVTRAPAIQILITPTSGPQHTQVAVIGTGFEAGSLVVEFNGTVVARPTVQVDGTFATSFMVPEVNSGSYQVIAIDSVKNNAFANFTVK